MGEKLNVKTTLLLTETDKKNIESDIQKLTEQLEKRFGVRFKIGRQDFLRGCLRSLHQNLLDGNDIDWDPIKQEPILKLAPKPESKPSPRRRKTK